MEEEGADGVVDVDQLSTGRGSVRAEEKKEEEVAPLGVTRASSSDGFARASALQMLGLCGSPSSRISNSEDDDEEEEEVESVPVGCVDAGWKGVSWRR